MTAAGEDHRQAMLITGGDYFGVLHRTAGLNEGDDASGVSIPIRVSFDNLEEVKRPASADPSFSELWNASGGEEEMVLRTVQRWRAQGR